MLSVSAEEETSGGRQTEGEDAQGDAQSETYFGTRRETAVLGFGRGSVGWGGRSRSGQLELYWPRGRKGRPFLPSYFPAFVLELGESAVDEVVDPELPAGELACYGERGIRQVGLGPDLGGLTVLVAPGPVLVGDLVELLVLAYVPD